VQGRGSPIPFSDDKTLWQATMLILCALFGYLALGGLAWFLYHKLTKAKEALFAARRQAVRDKAHKEAARKAVQVAEQRCMQALRDVELALGQAGQAMAVAGHIEVVSQQLHGLIQYIADPLDAGQATGRHALPDTATLPAITGGPYDTAKYTYEKQEELTS
jgi:hypothetical protein